jgi:hypothetical protein
LSQWKGSPLKDVDDFFPLFPGQSQLASFFVAITGERKDLPATNLLQNPRLASNAEISLEIEGVIRLLRGISDVQGSFDPFLDISKRARAILLYP